MKTLRWLTLAVALQANAQVAGPPYYQRPAELDQDLALLTRERAAGNADERWWLERLALYTNMGELDDIAPLVVELTKAWPQQPAFREARMMLESGRGHHDLAVDLGQSILAEYPNYRSIRVNLARVYQAKGDLVAALNMMISAIEAGPVRVQDWEFLLRALARGESSAKRTLQTLEQKIAQNPGLMGLKYLQVVLYTRFGQYDAARDVLVAHPELAAHPDLKQFVADVNAAFPPQPAATGATEQPKP